MRIGEGTAALARRYDAMTQIRRSVVHMQSPDKKLAECAREARKQAQLLPDGELRDALLEKVRQYEAQISRNAWLFAPPTSPAEMKR